ncbi:rhamnan synthesis F family protein [Psychrobacter celer]|uniref:rhamnan synthesis F family protein n=1 Tax=Psychrobacter celer TaxID=306572 RepID=UPI003FD239BD
MYKNTACTDIKIAIVIHAFYAKQFEAILDKISAIVVYAPKNIIIDIYVTVSDVSEPAVYELLESSTLSMTARRFSNYGMDLLPFFKLLPELQAYDWVLKLHTKNIKDDLSQIWFEQLIEGLIGSPDVFFDALKSLQNHPSWCMAGLLPFFMSAHKLMLDNQANVDKLARCWDVNLDEDWGFFAGSLYWVKPESLLNPAHQLLVHEAWFFEDFAKDGQMAHAVERLITKVAQNQGEIGLLMPVVTEFDKAPSLLVSSSNHRFSINHSSTKQLMQSYDQLEKDWHILYETSLLDTQRYAKNIAMSFHSQAQAIQHFLLIGQHNGFADYVYPLQLRQAESKLIDWTQQAKRERDDNLVSIIIPVLNNLKMTVSCLQSIYEHTQNIQYEIILLDNASKRLQALGFDVYAKLRRHIKVIHLSKNLNFSAGCNYAFSKSVGSTVVFLNNDTQVTAGWLDPILCALQRPDVAAVQPKLLYFDDTVQCAGVDFGADGFGVCRLEGKDQSDCEVTQSIETPALTAACIAVEAHDFIALQGFDTWFINGQEDIDFCLRLRQYHSSKKLWYEAQSTVYHHTSQTKGRRAHTAQNRKIFKSIWGSR